MKNQIVWCDIPVTDLDRAVKFYSAVLGAPVTKGNYEGMSFAVLPHEDDAVGGCLVAGPEQVPSTTGPLIYLNCDQRLDAAIAAVVENGGKILVPKHPIGPHGFRSVAIDSEGNRVALHSK